MYPCPMSEDSQENCNLVTGGAVVQLGDASDMDEKLARLLSLLRGGLDGVCELDVSTREVGSVPC